MLQSAVTSMWRALCHVIYHPAQVGISGVQSSSSCPLVSADYPCRVPRRFLLIHRILSKDGFALRLYFLLHIPSSFYTSSLDYYKIQGRTAKYSYRYIDDCLQSLYGPKVFQQPWIRMMTAVADAQRRWMCFAGALSGWPLGCPSSVLARHWQSSGALMRHHWGATHAQSTRRHQRGPSFF